MKNQILVLGGTGKTGKRVAEKLLGLNIPVRIGSRKASPSFDWEQPENWKDVLADIEKVYITIQPDLASPGSLEKIRNFAEAAKTAGVEKLVLLSGRGEPEALACENEVVNLGIDYTIVRASWFMQNFSEGFLYESILHGEVVLPPVTAKEPFIDVDDIGDMVVAALTSAEHSNKVYDITGPELLTFREAVSKISSGLNKPIGFTEVPLPEYLNLLRSFQLPDDFILLVEYLFSKVLDGRNESLTHDLEQVLKRKPGTFDEFVNKTTTTIIWEVEQSV